jgi:hypothetical protein
MPRQGILFVKNEEENIFGPVCADNWGWKEVKKPRNS